MTSNSKDIRVHIGAGGIYLKGYENLDVPIDEFYFAKSRPDIVRENITTIENYYKDPYYNNYYERFKLKLTGVKKLPKPKGEPSKNLKRRKMVIDQIAYANNLPYKPNSVSEILAVQVFEHFGPSEAKQVLKHWWSLLRVGGKLIIDVPDVIETAHLLVLAETEEEKGWAEKLIHGTRNNEFAYHKAGYWPKKLERMLQEAGFTSIKVNNQINHQYPAFSMEAIKK
ncbi:hypothetical protein A3B45_00340 [Candidatus Daviesbacteria bacterium RIFCSPLOWO2_01_FULL_39_12]|uniref:Methyltransferase type 11 domain-containing protein n=1 Tax=Candidatus Daviesbacteria bacterium RIFCSPLOWO2_01_FULL_39_12 TaxID=1797785 RepID=A0A1F5KP66_9BACT|nr:MAG: hypothetical protein A3B45_00340 [Candidatus Daviesbacteria bacterium RIFCSPLOWO2_01_FULL_39_12]